MFIPFAKQHVQSLIGLCLVTLKFTQLLFLADRDIVYTNYQVISTSPNKYV